MCSLTVAEVQDLCPLKLCCGVIACQSHTTRSCKCCLWGGRALYSCHIADVFMWQHGDWSLGLSCCRLKWQEERDHYFQWGSNNVCRGRQGIHSGPIHGRHLLIQQNYHQMRCVLTLWCLAEMSLSLKGGEMKRHRACDPLVWPTKIALLFNGIIKI